MPWLRLAARHFVGEVTRKEAGTVWWTDLLYQQRWMPWPKSGIIFLKKKRFFFVGIACFPSFFEQKIVYADV